jgi:hypothetical protein
MKERKHISGLVIVQKSLNTTRTIAEIKLRREPSGREPRIYRQNETYSRGIF